MHTLKRPIVFVIGTRPEGVKIAPVYHLLKKTGLPVVICSTMQHDQILSEVLDLFEITPDYVLNIMRLHQDLFYLTQSVLQKTKEIFMHVHPSLVLVQGDTTSSMAASIAAFYLGIPVGHIEAGLRTDDMLSPFPEEMNRRMISLIARYHFSPTQNAIENLCAQGVQRKQIFLTGNTVVDALYMMKEKIAQGLVPIGNNIKNIVDSCKQRRQKIIVLTMHRRESFDGGIAQVLHILKTYLTQNPDVYCIYPYHPNPTVLYAIEQSDIHELQNCYLSEPLLYSEMIYLIDRADLVMTDSGGLQEEAVSLSKQVLVLREKTERMEGVIAGFAHIVGTDQNQIYTQMEYILKQKSTKEIPIQEKKSSIYGDGHAAEKIVAVIRKLYADEILSIKSDVVKKVNNDKITYHELVVSQKKEKAMVKVSVIGLGYIGLPTAIVLADNGFDVIGFDIDKTRVERINAGDPVIQEPEIFEKLQVVLGGHNFTATTTLEKSDYFIIAVPTPLNTHKHANLDYVFNAAKSIALVLEKRNIVVVESTVPVGTTNEVAQFLQKQTGMQAGKDFFVVHSPERVLPGNIFKELVENDRIIGGINKDSVEHAKHLYKPWVQGRLYLTDAKTAEMVKLVENSSRDVALAFAHQVASMAYEIGLNPYEIIELANKHPRVNILRPTCGVGGHCIAIDPCFLIQTFSNTQLLQTARDINDAKPHEIAGFTKQTIKDWQSENQGKQCTLALLGMTYKADIDDLRESPALQIAKEFSNDSSIRVVISEPHVKKEQLYNYISHAYEVISANEAVMQADIIVFLVAHKRFKAIDRKMLQNKKILDFCRIFFEPKSHADADEVMFWPARSVLDFFITHQLHEPTQTHDTAIKESDI